MLLECKGIDGVTDLRPKIGLFWLEVGKMTTLEGQPRSNHLHKQMAGLMSIPVSNADCERGFSILSKIQTDQRSNLDQSTIVALMALKFNSDECCTEVKLLPELLRECKKATKSYVTPLSSSAPSDSHTPCNSDSSGPSSAAP